MEDTERVALVTALERLTEWACTHTSPRDANSPHALLIEAREALALAKAGAGAIPDFIRRYGEATAAKGEAVAAGEIARLQWKIVRLQRVSGFRLSREAYTILFT